MTGAATPGRILAIRVGRGGDLVMITPALRMLLDALPETELHLVTTLEGRRFLKGFDPRLTEFHLYHRGFFESRRLRGPLLEALRAAAYDRAYVFETHPHYRDRFAGVAPEFHVLGDDPGPRHYSERCMDLVAATLACPPARGWLTLPVTEAGRAAARDYLAAHGVEADAWLVGLHLTFSETGRGVLGSASGRRHREWPGEACGELARMLHAHGRERGIAVRPVLDVLPRDLKRAMAMLGRAGDAVTVLSGAPDFERYKAVLERLRLLVAPNTGPMHVAAAVGTPVVALFSGWSPADCGPFAPPGRARVLRAEDQPDPGCGLAALSAATVYEACRPFLP